MPRLDSQISLGAEPVLITPEGFRHYEGTATIGDVVLRYSANDFGGAGSDFRPADEVLSDEAVESMIGLPLTHEHPDGLLDPDTAKEHTEGAVIQARREEAGAAGNLSPRLRVRVVAYTRELQDAIEGGKVELSPGYHHHRDPSPGVFQGSPYEVVQRRVRYNHLAVVSRARTRTPAGEVARLDKDTTMELEITDAASRSDAPMLSAEDAKLLEALSEAGREMIMKALTAMKPAEDPKEGEGEGEGGEVEIEIKENGKMDMQQMMDRLDKMQAALDAMGGKRSDSEKPAKPSAPAAVDIEAITARAAQIASDQTAARVDSMLRDARQLESDGYRVDSFTANEITGIMLGAIKKHAPGLEVPATSAIKGGRMDDLRAFYKTAQQAGASARVDSDAAAIGAQLFGGADAFDALTLPDGAV